MVLNFTTPRYTLLFLYSEIYIVHVINCEWSRSIIFPLRIFCMRYKPCFSNTMDKHNFVSSFCLLLTFLLSSLLHMWEPWYCLSLAPDSFHLSTVNSVNPSFVQTSATILNESRPLFAILNVCILRYNVRDLDETYNTSLYPYLLSKPTWVEAIEKMVHLLSALTPVQWAFSKEWKAKNELTHCDKLTN